MHSNIIQISKNPIDKDLWVSPCDFYDNTNDFADYIGDLKGEEQRKEVIEWMAKDFGGIFEQDGETLIYKGLGDFLKEWNANIRELAGKLNDEAVDDMALYRVRRATEQTHLGICSRFSIEDWAEYPNPASELIQYVSTQLEEGDRLYIGAVIDYHF